MAGAFGLLGLMGQLYGTKELVCVLAEGESPMLRRVTQRFDPQLSVLVKREGDERLTAFAPFTANYSAVEGKNSFYLCENGACSLPMTEEPDRKEE